MKIQTDSENITNDYATGGPMWTGSGDRAVSKSIHFKEPFHHTPSVHVSVCYLDAGNTANLRYDINVVTVSRDHFDLTLKTWADTKLATLSISYIAIDGEPFG